jgi:hypothetical protein
MGAAVVAYLKEKVEAEKAVLVGAAASALVVLAGKAGIVIDEVTVANVLLPLATALVARVFVTSKGVKPGL